LSGNIGDVIPKLFTNKFMLLGNCKSHQILMSENTGIPNLSGNVSMNSCFSVPPDKK
jgi:hypothetical protein